MLGVQNCFFSNALKSDFRCTRQGKQETLDTPGEGDYCWYVGFNFKKREIWMLTAWADSSMGKGWSKRKGLPGNTPPARTSGPNQSLREDRAVKTQLGSDSDNPPDCRAALCRGMPVWVSGTRCPCGARAVTLVPDHLGTLLENQRRNHFMVLGIWKNKKSSQLEKERPFGASQRMRRAGRRFWCH